MRLRRPLSRQRQEIRQRNHSREDRLDEHGTPLLDWARLV
jgi:hypothetical protein